LVVFLAALSPSSLLVIEDSSALHIFVTTFAQPARLA
jgi:hypothetical protein